MSTLKDKLGCAAVRVVVVIDRLNTMQTNLTNTARSRRGALESVDIVGWLVVLKVMSIPAFVNTHINRPKISESHTVVRSLEDQVSDVGSLIGQVVDEELDLVEDANVILLVLDLEVAVRAGAVRHVDHVLVIDKSGKLGVRGGSCPGAVVEHSSLDDVVVGS